MGGRVIDLGPIETEVSEMAAQLAQIPKLDLVALSSDGELAAV